MQEEKGSEEREGDGAQPIDENSVMQENPRGDESDQIGR